MPIRPRHIAIVALALPAAALALHASGYRLVAAAGASSRSAAPPEAARIATCDVYQLVERMIDSDQYIPARNVEQERVKGLLSPFEADLEKMQKELQAADPKDPAAQEKFKAFQTKREEYMAKRQQAADGYTDLVTGQFADAYTRIAAEARKTAESLGYTHVIAHKRGDIRAHDPRQLVEEFLSRPITVAPDGTDITEQVRAVMKLPDKPSSSDSSPLFPANPGPSGLPASDSPRK